MNTYTAGQLAELAGVSTRTVRYYDQRGILHPSSYTESGYRLYDDKALLKMQRILMLKFAGFTLEETQNILLMEQGQDLRDILTNQYQMILEKKRQLDEITSLLERVLEQNPLTDLSEVVASMQLIKSNNHSIRTYQFCETIGQRPLYPWEFSELRLRQNMKVLDLGFGVGMLWRQSWDHIPEGLSITLVDIYEPFQESLLSFAEGKGDIEKKHITMDFQMVDAECFEPDTKYDRIVMAYLWEHLRNPEEMVEKTADWLAEDGELFFVVGTNDIRYQFDEIFQNYAGYSALEGVISQKEHLHSMMQDTLRKHFSAERLVFENALEFHDALTLYQFLMDGDPELSAEIRKQGTGFIHFLQKLIENKQTVSIHCPVTAYRCRREKHEHQNSNFE